MKSLQCDRCGGSLPFQQELGGRCVRCLLELGIVENTQGLEDDDRSDAACHLSVGTCVGRYRILRSIGEGGMGVVYEAEQDQPRRHVALKLIRPGMTGKATLRRFERETEALGRLQHPGIAQIYDAGAADTGFGPQPFFAMELIRGLTPGEYVKQHRLSVRERLELVAKVAEAIHHAHQRGIIHRDLKPSNILVDETGQPKVLDFGVSRAIDDDSTPRTRQTEIGQLLGTVAYMSPEQVAGDPHEIDIRSDIYALGVILYEVLANRPPYKVEGNLHEALTAVREVEPAPLGTLVRAYKGDIETIAAKALEKDKNRRYTSAAELAADIRRFLAEEPIIARPQSAAYQLRKFARRNKVLVRAAAMMVIALILGVIISMWQATRASLAEQAALAERDRARQAEAVANEERDRARQAELSAAEQRNLAWQAEVMATEQRSLALNAQQQAVAAAETANAERDRANTERDRALSMQQRADEEQRRAQSADDRARHEATVASTQRQIVVWQQLVRRAIGGSDYDLASLLAVQAFRIHTRIPGQRRQSTEEVLQQAAKRTEFHLLSTGGSTDYNAVAFSSDGMQLAAGGDDQLVRVWNMRTLGKEAPLLLNQRGNETGRISALEFSPDGRLLAVGLLGASLARTNSTIGTIRIWNLESAGATPLILTGGGDIESMAFSPDGKHLVSSAHKPAAFEAQYVVLWDLLNPKSPRILARQTSPYRGVSRRVSLSPNGTRVAVALETDVKVWDLRSPSRELFSLQPPPLASREPNPVHSVAFSPDGTHLAISSSGIHIWDLRNLQSAPIALTVPVPAQPPRLGISLLGYNSRGNHLAASINGSTWIWDLDNPAAITVSSRANAAAYSASGELLAVPTTTGVQLWGLPRGQAAVITPPIPRENPGVNFRQFVYSSDLTQIFDAIDRVPKLWDLRQSPPRTTPLADATGAVFCKNDTRLLLTTSSRSGPRLTVWDVGAANSAPTHLRSRELYSPPAGSAIACSVDGTRAAIAVSRPASEAGVQIIDLERSDMSSVLTLREVNALSVVDLAFSPDGKILAVGGPQSVDLWDLTNPGVPKRSLPLLGQARRIVFSPDGSRVAALSTGGWVMWEVHKAITPLRFPSPLLAFEPNGTRVATVGGPSLVEIRDLENPAQPMSWQSPGSSVVALGFSADGLRLRAGDTRGSVSEWPIWSGAADLLCARVWRNLSMNEWAVHVGEDIPYERTCPNLPPGTGAPGGPK